MPSTLSPVNSLYPALIASRLPAWLANASTQGLQRLEALTARAQASRRALQAAANALPQYSAYASDRLRGVLSALGEHGVDPNQAVLHWASTSDNQPPLTCTLVQAALRNFTEADTEAGAFGQGSGLFTRLGADGKPEAASRLRTSPWVFARACRQADIGGGFAIQLAAQLPSAVAGTGNAAHSAFPRLFCEAEHDNLAAEACIAALRGRLDSTGQALLANWIASPGAVPAALPASAKRLRLFGFDLDRVLVILSGHDDHEGKPCLLYVPNDPEAPLAQFASPQALFAALHARLGHPAYVRFLAGCVALEDEPAFVRAVEGPPPEDFDHLFTTALNPLRALELAVEVLKGQRPTERPSLTHAFVAVENLFSEGYARWVSRTLADAAVLAVPTARADRIAALARHQHWVALGEQLGLFVLSFIPGVGQVIAVYSMVQLLRNLYDASMAWEQGDEHVARSLLLGSAENARFLLPAEHRPSDGERQRLLERLELVAGPSGESRLWLPDLPNLGDHQAPAGTGPLPEDGLLRADGRAWVRCADRYIEVAPEATAYEARPILPEGARARASRLLSNGQGGWHGEYERPEQWSRVTLIRRFGTVAAGMEDAAIELASRLAGVDQVALHGRLSRGEPLPGLLRHWLHRRANAKRLRQAAESLQRSTVQPLVDPAVLRTLADIPGWPGDVGLELEQPDGQVIPVLAGHPRTLRITHEALTVGRWPSVVFTQLGDLDLSPLVGRFLSAATPGPVSRGAGPRLSNSSVGLC